MDHRITNLLIEHDETGENIVRIQFEFGPGYLVEAHADGSGTTLRLHRPDLTVSLDTKGPKRHYERALNLLNLHLR